MVNFYLLRKKSTFLGEFREFCLSFLFLWLDHGKNSRVVLNQNKRQSLYPAYWNLFTRVRGEQHLLVSDWKVGYDLEDNNLYSQLDINTWALGICFTSVPQPVPKGYDLRDQMNGQFYCSGFAQMAWLGFFYLLNNIVSGSILPPQNWDKSHLDEAGIEPRSSRSASDRFIHTTMAPRHDVAAAMALRQHPKDAGRTIFNAEPSLINETRKIIGSQHRIFFSFGLIRYKRFPIGGIPRITENPTNGCIKRN